MAEIACSLPEDGWGGRSGRLEGVLMVLPKIMVLTPIFTAEPIDLVGDPSDEVLKGSPRFYGGWEGWISRAEPSLGEAGDSFRRLRQV